MWHEYVIAGHSYKIYTVTIRSTKNPFIYLDTPCFSCKFSIVSKNSTLSRSCILFCKAKFAIKCFEISATVFEEYEFWRVWFLESMRVWFLSKEFVFYGNFTYLAMKIHLQVGFSWFYVVTVIYSLLGIKPCYRKMIWLPVPSFQPIRKRKFDQACTVWFRVENAWWSIEFRRFAIKFSWIQDEENR